MRYAREQNDGGPIRLCDIIDIPAVVDASAFLAVNRPGVEGYIHVADDNVTGAVKQEDGTYLNPSVPGPQPNTTNNPYFGKQKLTGAGFVGLCIGVLGVTAANRITEDKAFSAIKLWVTTADVVVDPDDKVGKFLEFVGLPGGDGYLTTALAADGQPLMTKTQRDAIMAAWK